MIWIIDRWMGREFLARLTAREQASARESVKIRWSVCYMVLVGTWMLGCLYSAIEIRMPLLSDRTRIWMKHRPKKH